LWPGLWYGAARPEFPPRPEQGGQKRTERRTGGLKQQLILELSSMTLRREDGTDHFDARPLHARERVGRGEAKRKGQDGDREMACEGSHEARIT
jgi:hypothetical protein